MKNIINILSFAAVLVFVCNFCFAQQKTNASTAIIKDKEIKIKTKTEVANELLQKRQKEKESIQKALPVSESEYILDENKSESEILRYYEPYYPKNDLIIKKAEQPTAPAEKNNKRKMIKKNATKSRKHKIPQKKKVIK